MAYLGWICCVVGTPVRRDSDASRPIILSTESLSCSPMQDVFRSWRSEVWQWWISHPATYLPCNRSHSIWCKGSVTLHVQKREGDTRHNATTCSIRLENMWSQKGTSTPRRVLQEYQKHNVEGSRVCVLLPRFRHSVHLLCLFVEGNFVYIVFVLFSIYLWHSLPMLVYVDNFVKYFS